MTGSYNAVSPSPQRFRELMDAIAKSLNRRKVNIPVPLSVLKLMMGEFVGTLADSIRCSSKKVEETGFVFQYRTLQESLENIFEN